MKLVQPDTENSLIEAAKNNEEGALKQLFEEYRPLVEKSKRKIYFRDYDDADWEQDALIVCHQAVLKFNPERGRFGSFYKNQLRNHVVSLIRYRNAIRRLGDEINFSLEGLQEAQSPLVEEKGETPIKFIFSDDIHQGFLDSLSDIELAAFKIELGVCTIDEVKEKMGVDEEQLKRARARAYKKFWAVLFQD